MSDDRNSSNGLTRSPGLTRRAFLRRSLSYGAGVVAGSTLLAACWPFGDDEDDDSGDEEDEDVETTPEATSTPEPTEEASPTQEPSPTPEPSPTEVPVPDEPESGGTMVVALPADPWSLHPNADETATNWIVTSQIHSALMNVDHNFEVVPDLAENVDVAEDGSSYTFTVPQGVLFHNGEQMTANDVVYSHRWMQDGENGGARSFYYERVESIEAPDETTVVFSMGSPDGTFLRRAATTLIVHEATHEEMSAEAHSLDPVGTGPFMLESWDREQVIRLSRFNDFFGDAPFLDGLEFQIMPDAAARASALESGEVDAAYDLEVATSNELSESDDVTSFEIPSLDVLHIALNNEHPVLSGQNVRLAMLYAIERPPLIDLLYEGAGTSATSYLSPALEMWHEAMLEEDAHLPDRAVELLEQAGWTEGDDGIREREGERLSFTCIAPDNGDGRAEAAEMIAEMLAEVGIEMQVETAPLTDTLNQMREGERDAAIFNWTYGGWLGEPDGRTTLQTGAFNNFCQFSSAHIDTLMAQGVGQIDQEARRSTYVTVQERVAELVPFLFLAFPHSFYHFGSRVQGLPESANWGFRIFGQARQFWIFDPEA